MNHFLLWMLIFGLSSNYCRVVNSNPTDNEEMSSWTSAKEFQAVSSITADELSKQQQKCIDSSWNKLEILPKSIGSIEYDNVEIRIYSHSKNGAKFYFAPISLINDSSARSYYNQETKQAEMDLRVELWNDQVKAKVAQWLQQQHFQDQVTIEVIPFNQIALSSSTSADLLRRRYQLPSAWTNYQQQKDFTFKIICSSSQDCDELARNIRTHSAHFQLQFQVEGQKYETKQAVVKVDNLMSCPTASKLQNQLAKNEFILLTAKDEHQLLRESVASILMDTLTDDSITDIASSDSWIEIYNFLKNNLIEQGKKVITDVNDKRWDAVYWNNQHNDYRPHLMAKTFNEIYTQKLDKDQRHKLVSALIDANNAVLGAVAEVKAKLDQSGDGSSTSVEGFLQEAKETIRWDGRQTKFVLKPISLSRCNFAKLKDAKTWTDRSVWVRYSKSALSSDIVHHEETAETKSTARLADKEINDSAQEAEGGGADFLLDSSSADQNQEEINEAEQQQSAAGTEVEKCSTDVKEIEELKSQFESIALKKCGALSTNERDQLKEEIEGNKCELGGWAVISIKSRFIDR